MHRIMNAIVSVPDICYISLIVFSTLPPSSNAWNLHVLTSSAIDKQLTHSCSLIWRLSCVLVWYAALCRSGSARSPTKDLLLVKWRKSRSGTGTKHVTTSKWLRDMSGEAATAIAIPNRAGSRNFWSSIGATCLRHSNTTARQFAIEARTMWTSLPPMQTRLQLSQRHLRLAWLVS